MLDADCASGNEERPRASTSVRWAALRSVAMLFNQPPVPKADAEKPRHRPKRARRRWIPCVGMARRRGISAALVLLAVLWSVGVFRVNTKDGVYEVEVDVPNAEVYRGRRTKRRLHGTTAANRPRFASGRVRTRWRSRRTA